MENDDLRKLTLDQLLSKCVDGLSDSRALTLIALLVDLSGDLRRLDGAERALFLSDQLEDRLLNDQDAVLLDYYRANAWSVIRNNKDKSSSGLWSWEHHENGKELFHLRRAIKHPGFKNLDKTRCCQILTNLGNQLSSMGRSIEALEYWNRALAIEPNFGMAIGNRGYGLSYYARALYDHGHAAIVLMFAYEDLNKSGQEGVSYESFYDAAKGTFAQTADAIARHVDIAHTKSLALDGYSLGASIEEQAYRKWCLQHGLFLNPLNDIGTYSIAARDIFSLPSIVFKVGQAPNLVGYFNQLKQEYVSARYFFYAGIGIDQTHFADRDVLIFDTLDFPEYSIGLEKVRMAFRMLYSLFDKIAFFINSYWSLEVPDQAIYFHSIWYRKTKDAKVLRDRFVNYENWPLRGLFWLSKDVCDKDTDLSDTLEPDGEELRAIRNSLEHRYLKVHGLHWKPDATQSLYDSLAHSVAREDLERKTLRMLKLVRASLIYVSLAVHREEALRREKNSSSAIGAMRLPTLPDDRKR